MWTRYIQVPGTRYLQVMGTRYIQVPGMYRYQVCTVTRYPVFAGNGHQSLQVPGTRYLIEDMKKVLFGKRESNLIEVSISFFSRVFIKIMRRIMDDGGVYFFSFGEYRYLKYDAN